MTCNINVMIKNDVYSKTKYKPVKLKDRCLPTIFFDNFEPRLSLGIRCLINHDNKYKKYKYIHTYIYYILFMVSLK